MSKLLLDERPLIVLPELAVIIGLNEAIFLQQIHYWLQRSKNDIKGQKWTYNSYESLQKQFSFFSISTIKRIIKNLKEKDILMVDNFNADCRDKTNWYSINYDVFNALVSSLEETNALGQSEPMDKVNMNQCIVKSLTETTTENKKNIKKIKTSFPQNDAGLKAYAILKAAGSGIRCPIQTYEAFRDHHMAKGSKFVNWESAFNTWVTNFFKYESKNDYETIIVNNLHVGTYNFSEEFLNIMVTKKMMMMTKDYFINGVIKGNIVLKMA